MTKRDAAFLDAIMGARKLKKEYWADSEDVFILGAVRRYGTQWAQIAVHMPGRSEDAVRNRWHRLRKMYMGPDPQGKWDQTKSWLLEASEKAIEAIETVPIPEPADRARFAWTAEEDQLILDGVKAHGCKWRQIVAQLPGRSDSSARNRWLRLQREMPEYALLQEFVPQLPRRGDSTPPAIESRSHSPALPAGAPALATAIPVAGLPLMEDDANSCLDAGIPLVHAQPIYS